MKGASNMPAKTVTTTLEVERKCKSSVRYVTKDKGTEKTLITIYVLNDALKKLGNPKEIEVTLKEAK